MNKDLDMACRAALLDYVYENESLADGERVFLESFIKEEASNEQVLNLVFPEDVYQESKVLEESAEVAVFNLVCELSDGLDLHADYGPDEGVKAQAGLQKRKEKWDASRTDRVRPRKQLARMQTADAAGKAKHFDKLLKGSGAALAGVALGALTYYLYKKVKSKTGDKKKAAQAAARLASKARSGAKTPADKKKADKQVKRWAKKARG